MSGLSYQPVMLVTLTVPEGLGCRQCVDAPPITTTESRAGKVRLCLACTLRWFPGRSADWFETRHAPLSDHLADKMRRAAEREKAANDAYFANVSKIGLGGR